MAGQRFQMEGNNGRDSVTLTQVTEDELLLEIKHDNVMAFSYQVPIEFLTCIFASLAWECPMVQDYAQWMINRWCTFSEERRAEILSKVRKIVW